MSKNTVFVIGAGASSEVDLPTGDVLKQRIAELLDIHFDEFLASRPDRGDHIISGSLSLHINQHKGQKGDINSFLDEAHHIVDAMPQAISIDNFIDQHSDNKKIALCGKLAIVRSILDAEKNSRLQINRLDGETTIDFSDLEKTWYTPFFQLLTENRTKHDLEERFKFLTLIIFNYDRCIEHYLFHALQNFYRISENESAELIKHIHIYHPYGDVGTLPWIKQNGAMPFGETPRSEKLLELADNIKTFTEGTDPDSSEIKEIRTKVEQADRLVFLGFAFHKLNMELISPQKTEYERRESIKCFATTLNSSKTNKEVIHSQVNDLYALNSAKRIPVNMQMANLKCKPFFDEYWKNLSF